MDEESSSRPITSTGVSLVSRSASWFKIVFSNSSSSSMYNKLSYKSFVGVVMHVFSSEMLIVVWEGGEEMRSFYGCTSDRNGTTT